jgi:sulfoacetaldehyde acetyltransferase
MFYGDVETVIPEPKVIERSAGGVQSIAEAVQLLSKAKRPVIVSGGGIVMSGGVDAVVKLAEQLQAPVCSTYLHNDSFPKSHPLWMGKKTKPIMTSHCD